MSTEAMKLALEALEWMVANDDTNEGDEPLDRLGGQSWNEYNSYWIDGLNNARASITALQEALAQPQQEPVAWAIFTDAGNARMWSTFQPHLQKLADAEGLTITPLYTSPPARKPLTDGEIETVWRSVQANDFHDCVKPFARAIEAAHGIEENT